MIPFMAEDVRKRFEDRCAYFGIKIVAIKSGFAYLSHETGDAIVSLPTKITTVWKIAEFLRRNQRGRFLTVHPKYQCKNLCTPSESWEKTEALARNLGEWF